MKEVFAEAFSLVNLPFTILLGVVILYWLLVALGAVSEHGADSDGTLEAHGDGDFHADSGWLGGIFHFVNLGEVPVTIAVSILSLCLWLCSMISNHYFTDHRLLLALAFLLPNIIVSALATRFLTLPLRPLFRLLRRAEGEAIPLVGRPCRITTSTANPSFGQAEVETKGAPLLIDVRTLDGVSLPRGANAVIFREDNERGIYFVVEVSDPQLS